MEATDGKAVADAREGGTSGCVETGAFGKEAYILTGYFNLPKVLELSLDNGVDPRTGKRIGIETGDPKDDGWFSSSEGKKDALSHGAQYVDFYRALSLGENSGNFGAPRQIRFGVRLDY